MLCEFTSLGLGLFKDRVNSTILKLKPWNLVFTTMHVFVSVGVYSRLPKEMFLFSFLENLNKLMFNLRTIHSHFVHCIIPN